MAAMRAIEVTDRHRRGFELPFRVGLRGFEAIAKRVRAYIVTRGVHGSYVYTDGERLVIPTVPAEQVVDPTGCGDAYRAGVIFGLQHGFDWQTTGRIASLMGTIKIGHSGTQNHRFTQAEFQDRFRAAFGYCFG